MIGLKQKSKCNQGGRSCGLLTAGCSVTLVKKEILFRVEGMVYSLVQKFVNPSESLTIQRL